MPNSRLESLIGAIWQLVSSDLRDILERKGDLWGVLLCLICLVILVITISIVAPRAYMRWKYSHKRVLLFVLDSFTPFQTGQGANINDLIKRHNKLNKNDKYEYISHGGLVCRLLQKCVKDAWIGFFKYSVRKELSEEERRKRMETSGQKREWLLELEDKEVDIGKVCNAFRRILAYRKVFPEKGIVVNMSWSSSALRAESFLRPYIEKLIDQRILMVAATGNDNSGVPTFPAAYPGIIAVSDASLENGKASYANFGIHVSFCAEGSVKVPFSLTIVKTFFELNDEEREKLHLPYDYFIRLYQHYQRAGGDLNFGQLPSVQLRQDVEVQCLGTSYAAPRVSDLLARTIANGHSAEMALDMIIKSARRLENDSYFNSGLLGYGLINEKGL